MGETFLRTARSRSLFVTGLTVTLATMLLVTMIVTAFAADGWWPEPEDGISAAYLWVSLSQLESTATGLILRTRAVPHAAGSEQEVRRRYRRTAPSYDSSRKSDSLTLHACATGCRKLDRPRRVVNLRKTRGAESQKLSPSRADLPALFLISPSYEVLPCHHLARQDAR